MKMLRALWDYRGFVLGSIKREFQSKYQNSLLGATWSIINPLSMIVVYSIVFTTVMRARLPGLDSTFAYSIYLCAGILTWGLFTEIANRCTGVFLEHANLLKKLSFPRLTLPVVVVCSALINFFIIFTLFLLFLVFSGNFPGWLILAMLPVLAIQVVFSIGLGISLGILNVFFRDVGQFFSMFITFWFWLTPIVYPINILPASGQAAMRYNPMAGLMDSYQQILVYGKQPNWSSLWPVLVLGVLLCLYGFWQFRRHVGEMVDEL